MVKKKILILHAPNTYNYGSFMMLINFINYLNKESKDKAEFIVDFQTQEDLIRLQKELGKNTSPTRVNLNDYTYSSNKLKRIKNIIFYGKSFINNLNIDAVIILGGDDLSEYYNKSWILIDLYKIYKLNKKVNVFLVGQTIGPFSSYRIEIARSVLKKCNIYTRDSANSEYLRDNLKIHDFFESSDLAFLDLPNKDNKIYTLKKYNLIKDSYITIVTSGLTTHYTSNKDDYIDSWVRIIKGLLVNNKLKNKKIVLLSHVLKPEHVDDRKIIKKIEKMLTLQEKKRIIFIVNEMLPSEARFILGNGLFTITGRMHAAISTFQKGKPAISLSYSVKYSGIIGKDLEMNDMLIEAKRDNLWKSEYIVNQVNNKVDYILNNNQKLKKEINKKVEFLKIKALSQIKDIAKKIEHEKI